MEKGLFKEKTTIVFSFCLAQHTEAKNYDSYKEDYDQQKISDFFYKKYEKFQDIEPSPSNTYSDDDFASIASITFQNYPWLCNVEIESVDQKKARKFAMTIINYIKRFRDAEIYPEYRTII